MCMRGKDLQLGFRTDPAKGGYLLYVIADAECAKACNRGVSVWSVLRQ